MMIINPFHDALDRTFIVLDKTECSLLRLSAF
jgi:hypothetical protein